MKKRNSYFSILLLLLTTLLFQGCKSDETTKILPIWGEREVVYRMENGVEVADTIYPKVPDFRYLNQDSVWVTAKDFKGKVWIVDFMFTKCPTICPPMTTNMKRLSVMLNDLSNDIHFLSFSIDPYRDSPSVLRQYIKDYGIKARNWTFMTGVDELETHEMAKLFFCGAEKDESVAGGFAHTTYFALIDKNGYVRNLYEGDVSESIDSLANDVRLLLKTEYNVVGTKN